MFSAFLFFVWPVSHFLKQVLENEYVSAQWLNPYLLRCFHRFENSCVHSSLRLLRYVVAYLSLAENNVETFSRLSRNGRSFKSAQSSRLRAWMEYMHVVMFYQVFLQIWITWENAMAGIAIMWTTLRSIWRR